MTLARPVARPGGCAVENPRATPGLVPDSGISPVFNVMTTLRSDMLGLTLQQPWAELILRGVKTIEIRAVPVAPGKTVYLYASRRQSVLKCATAARRRHGLAEVELPRGKVVGTVHITGCRPAQAADSDAACVPRDLLEGTYSWQLSAPHRLSDPLDALHAPCGMWFYPFRVPPPRRARRKRT